MRFANDVFTGAGVWGIVGLTPLFWLLDLTGRHYPPPTEYPHFVYGFFSVALAWQIAFLVIGWNPVRFRPLMIPAVLEKLSFVATTVVMYGQSRISGNDAQVAIPDLLLCVLFVLAFVKTRGLQLVGEGNNSAGA